MRIRREYTWQTNQWKLTNEVRYIYDHRLVIQERDSNNVPKLTYTRGLDLDGGFELVGGIGGLLALTQNGPTNQHFYYDDDGAGNVTGLFDTNLNQVAYYLYDPFGDPIFASGPMAAVNHYGSWSKEFFSNSRMINFGLRFYDPALQRWINQDPIGEQGGVNLYSMVLNDPVSSFDAFGLEDVDVCIWKRKGLGVGPYSRVGHVLVKEAGTKEVLLSQFPHDVGQSSKPRGPNTRLSLDDTRKEEGGLETVRFRIHLPNDDAFNKVVRDEVGRPYWNWDPTKTNQTHCARSAYDALKAGGLPIHGKDRGQIFPGQLEDILETFAKNPASLEGSECSVNELK